ncbi:hypothetical protein DFH28DRAFT_1127774 [Melampsora americana]|nr:hypothetical protein DFH28DRAFT_1127774 [Melampsora americana]
MPLVGPGLASCCSILSSIGVIFLLAIGLGFQNHAHVLMGSITSPENGTKVARVCFMSAFVYLVILIFCGCQLGANRRVVRGGGLQL